jgi:hypothetical protein
MIQWRMDLMAATLKALGNIKDPTLFLDERGYQGEFKSKLDRILETHFPPDDFATPQVRVEYQKRAEAHGIILRPDLIIHVPFERGVSPTRKHDNYVVMLLKRAPSRAKAMENFASLEVICSTLNYPIGVSISIASAKKWLPEVPPEIPSSFVLHEINVTLQDGKPVIEIATRNPNQRR